MTAPLPKATAVRIHSSPPKGKIQVPPAPIHACHSKAGRRSVRDGKLFVATCPEVGTASQGTTVDEAVVNLKETTELYLEEFPMDPPPGHPFLTMFSVACRA